MSGTGVPSEFVRIDRERNTFKVSRRAFTEPHVLEMEREAIFDKCWLYVGHASELAKPGAFVTRAVGGRNIIFNRDAKGEIHAFLNTCPHRGMKLCRESSGSSKNFTCFYHGWVFGADGLLRDIPGREAYPEDFGCDHSADLVPVPRLDSHRDFWFLCFDPDAISLSDYLGDAKEMISVVADHAEEGMEIVSGAQEYGIRANWKLIMENSLDGYHAATTHATYFDYLRNLKLDLSLSGTGAPVDLGHGHAAIEYVGAWGRPVAKWASTMGEENRAEVDRVFAGLVERLGEARAKRVAHGNRNIGIFPNLVINDTMGLVVRTFYPVATDMMHISSWSLGPRGESAEMRKFRLANFIEFLGPGGLATPDDVEALENCQRGFANLKEAPWTDLSKGLGRPGGEQRMDDEAQTRTFWLEWDRRMHDVVPLAEAAE